MLLPDTDFDFISLYSYNDIKENGVTQTMVPREHTQREYKLLYIIQDDMDELINTIYMNE